jgi:glycosyltransferase involved in cell wall biosynthesis
LRILFLAPEPFFEPRGTPIAIFNLVRVLGKLGHQVELLTYHLGQPVELPGVRIRRIMGFPFIRKIPIGPSYRKLFLDVFLFARAWRLLKQERFDVIHGVEEAAYLAALLGWIFKTHFVYDMDSNIPEQLKYSGFFLPLVKGLIARIEAAAVTRARMIISVCSDLTEKVRQRFPGKKIFQIEDLPLFEGVRVAPESVAALRTKLGITGGPVVLYTGNFEKYQGVELLAEAAVPVIKRFPEVKFVLAGGEKPQVEALRRKVSALGLASNFILTGKVPLEEIPVYLEISSVLVSPRVKGTNVPMKIYSYLFSGRPLLATNILAHTQVLNEQVALLAAPERTSFSDGLLKLLTQPNLGRQLSATARILAENKFSSRIYEQKVEEAYRFLEESLR